MNIYGTLYELLETYVFGGEIVAETMQDLVATLMSTAGTIFLVAIPFMVVWFVIKTIGGR